MKHLLSFVALFFLLILPWSPGFCETVDQPKAEIPENVFHFDPVPEGTSLVHGFVVKNVGEGVLFIQKVRTG